MQGCNVTSGNMSAHGTYPIVIYMPNAPPPTVNEQTFFTNTTTLTLNYETDDTVKFLDAAHANALKGWENTTAGEQSDDMWPLCVKCATVDRARQRAGLTRSAACAGCFNKCTPTLSLVSDYAWSSVKHADSALTVSQTAGPSPLLRRSPTSRQALEGHLEQLVEKRETVLDLLVRLYRPSQLTEVSSLW